MTELCIQGLTKSFAGRQVLRGIDLTVASGRLVAILGASGSGKTTLLRLLSGFERPDCGSIRTSGRVLAGPGSFVPPELRQIGYVAQEGALFPHLSVADNILFGLPRGQRRAGARLDELLDLVGLPRNYAPRPPHELSGGEQQRVALARALAPRPALVLLDEPFSSLDAALRAGTRAAVANALSAAGATALLVTHDQAEALSMAHQVALLREGRLVQVASPEIFYRRPADAALAQFLGDAVLLPGFAKGRKVLCALGELQLPEGMPEGAVDVMVRPEQIRLNAGHLRPVGDTDIVATVGDVTFYGQDTMLRLHLAGTASGVAVAARVGGPVRFRPGDLVRLHVEGEVVVYPRAGRAAEAETAPPPLPRAAHPGRPGG
jgi:iron(III) transport system ATP-binding protein